MNYYVPAQCVALDKLLESEFGLDPKVLMENAGRSCAEVIASYVSDTHVPIAIVCGPGRNGGDGCVIARVLHDRGYRVQVFHFLPEDHQPKPECVYHAQLIKKLCIPYTTIRVGDVAGCSLLPSKAIYIDAIFGIGAREPFDAFWLGVFDAVNKKARYSISIDHPSGYATSDGAIVSHVCVQPKFTCSIGLPKFSHATHAGISACGKVEMCDAGFPEMAIHRIPPFAEGLRREWVRKVLRKPPVHAHKNKMGHLGIYAGSRTFSGALRLLVQGAMVCGVGKVTVFGTPSDMQVFRRLLPPEVIGVEGDPLTLGKECERRGVRAVVVGPGLEWPSGAISQLVQQLASAKIPIILDAEAFRAFGLEDLEKTVKIPKNSSVAWIGHLGEQSRFFGIQDVDNFFRQSLVLFGQWVEKYPLHVWLRKGSGSVVFTQKNVWLNESGNVGLAKGGSGDLLAGMIGAFALRYPLPQAVALAVWIHGHVADRIAAKKGIGGVTPSQCVRALPKILQELYV